MKTSFKNGLLFVWLLGYLSVAQVAFGQFVLCIEDDGHVSIEAGSCDCHSKSAATFLAVSMDNAETHACGPCWDIITEIDTARIAIQERQSPHLLATIPAHPKARSPRLYLDCSKTTSRVLRYNFPFHPSTSTTILLI